MATKPTHDACHGVRCSSLLRKGTRCFGDGSDEGVLLKNVKRCPRGLI